MATRPGACAHSVGSSRPFRFVRLNVCCPLWLTCAVLAGLWHCSAVQAQDVQYVLDEVQFSAGQLAEPELIQLASWQSEGAPLPADDIAYSGPACADSCAAEPACDNLQRCESCGPAWLENLTFFAGIDGSKQPQDFGVNANLGGRASFNWGVPLAYDSGLGLQVGSAIVGAGNAVRVYELMGEDTDRVQSFNTLGLFQRMDSGFSWAFVYDYLYQESFDRFSLSQWRGRVAYDLTACQQVGVTMQLSEHRDTGEYNATTVTLDPITQGSIFWRMLWESGTQTTFWAGLAEGHGESNAVTGFSPPTDEVFLFGADILAPLNDRLALYGETNLMMPADTGTVDAFLGIEWYPWGGAYQNRRKQFSPMLPVAGSTSFSVDLSQ